MFWFRKKIYKWLRREMNRRLNVDFVPLVGNESLHSHLREILRDYRIDIVIDVGANEGQFGREIRSIGFRGDLHSFEPVRRTFGKLLETRAGDDHWFAHNFALGDAPGNATIHVFAQSVFSSVLAANDWATGRFPGLKPAGEEQIRISTLDAFLAEAGIGRNKRILLKMDTQGYDLKVFEGARQSLGQVCALVSEVSFIAIYEGMPNYAQTLSAYEKGGYAISGIFPVSRNKDLSLVEMDCVMVRREGFETPSGHEAPAGALISAE